MWTPGCASGLPRGGVAPEVIDLMAIPACVQDRPDVQSAGKSPQKLALSRRCLGWLSSVFPPWQARPLTLSCFFSSAPTLLHPRCCRVPIPDWPRHVGVKNSIGAPALGGGRSGGRSCAARSQDRHESRGVVFARIRPVSAPCRPNSTRSRPNSVDFDRGWPELGKRRLAFQECVRNATRAALPSTASVAVGEYPPQSGSSVAHARKDVWSTQRRRACLHDTAAPPHFSRPQLRGSASCAGGTPDYVDLALSEAAPATAYDVSDEFSLSCASLGASCEWAGRVVAQDRGQFRSAMAAPASDAGEHRCHGPARDHPPHLPHDNRRRMNLPRRAGPRLLGILGARLHGPGVATHHRSADLSRSVHAAGGLGHTAVRWN